MNKFNSLEGKENKHHVCQSSFYPFHFIRSNEDKEEHEHAFCLLSKKTHTHTLRTSTRTRMEFSIYSYLRFHHFVYLWVFFRCKKSFQSASKSSFSFFSSIRPFLSLYYLFFCSFKYHPLKRCHPNQFLRKYSMTYAGN